MSLTTEEIIGGMYRAHRAGQPFAALMANPHFANLPLSQKQEVLQGLRQRLGGESTSAATAISTVLKSMAGGAMGAVPLGVAIPLGLEMSQGASKQSVLDALRMASRNRNVRLLVGTGAAIGAAGGLVRSVMNLHANRQDRARIDQELEGAAKGGEDLSTALFGGIGQRSAPSRFSTAPVASALGHAAAPSIMASARVGHYDAMSRGVDPQEDNALVNRVIDKMRAGYPVDPDRLNAIQNRIQSAQGARAAMHDIVVNSRSDLNIDPPVAAEIANDLQQAHEQDSQNIGQLGQLAELARDMRNAKRGNA